jgi:hypothetical protein
MYNPTDTPFLDVPNQQPVLTWISKVAMDKDTGGSSIIVTYPMMSQ